MGAKAAGFMLLLAMSGACAQDSSVAPEGVFLPRVKEHSDVWPSALVFGELFERDGCIFIHPGYEGIENLDYLLIWPKEATADLSDKGTLRVFVDGNLVGEMGDHVELGGGLVGEARDQVDQAESLTGVTIPERCRADGGYWITPGS